MTKANTCKSGIVSRALGNTVYVRMERNSACKECHAKGACLASDVGHIDVSVKTPDAASYKPGDRVSLEPLFNVFHAILFAFVLPLVLLIGIVFIANHFFAVSESVSYLSALGALVVYFVILKLFNAYFTRKYQYTLKKL
ncbi:MAG: SoxR reducing system RseC family protein [Porphyromonas sp.]|nr:SoxR reducing system RseC family protein [Porphyromonas sp.]